MSATNSRRFMCGWPPPGERKLSVPHRSRLQSTRGLITRAVSMSLEAAGFSRLRRIDRLCHHASLLSRKLQPQCRVCPSSQRVVGKRETPQIASPRFIRSSDCTHHQLAWPSAAVACKPAFSPPVDDSRRPATIAHKRIGTPRNAPTGPHIQLQHAMERKTRNGLIVSR